MNPDNIKQLILHSNEPLVFKNTLSWNIVNWDVAKWQQLFKKDEMKFRLGLLQATDEPQWERKTKLVKSTFDYFLEQSQCSNDSWLYFDYKYLRYTLTDAEELKNEINWAPLGFPDIKSEDCTIWIGSKGAHTPCHIDTYGYNLIYQIYGKKLWVLVPPEENLKPTRIPYEESSIYSLLNFFSPKLKDFQGVTRCKILILEPGDVLYLPHHWWHYVENLEIAISINVWIPSPQDDEERLKEALVQLFVKQICDSSNEETTGHILNPNMEEVLSQDVGASLHILHASKAICTSKLRDAGKKQKKESSTATPPENFDLDAALNRNDFVCRIPTASKTEFEEFLTRQRDRFRNEAATEGKIERKCVEEDNVELLGVLTDPDVISLIQKKLLKNRP